MSIHYEHLSILNIKGDEYGSAQVSTLCTKAKEVDGRNGCNSDLHCLKNARRQCSGDRNCVGISWYEKRTQQPLKLCLSTKTEKNLGWRTIMTLKKGI